MNRELYKRVFDMFGKDPHIEIIIPADDVELADLATVDLSQLKGDGKFTSDSIRRYLIGLYGYVMLPFIVDRFTHAKDRDKWRMNVGVEKGEEGWDLLNQNALRPQTIIGARNFTDMLGRHSGIDGNTVFGHRFHTLVSKIISLAYGESFEEYTALPKMEQVDYIAQYKLWIVGLLKHITTPSDHQE